MRTLAKNTLLVGVLAVQYLSWKLFPLKNRTRTFDWKSKIWIWCRCWHFVVFTLHWLSQNAGQTFLFMGSLSFWSPPPCWGSQYEHRALGSELCGILLYRNQTENTWNTAKHHSLTKVWQLCNSTAPESTSPLKVWPHVCILLIVSRSKTLQSFYCTYLWPTPLSSSYPSVEQEFSHNSVILW